MTFDGSRIFQNLLQQKHSANTCPVFGFNDGFSGSVPPGSFRQIPTDSDWAGLEDEEMGVELVAK